MKIAELTDPAGWGEWVATRPAVVQDLCRRYPPDREGAQDVRRPPSPVAQRSGAEGARAITRHEPVRFCA